MWLDLQSKDNEDPNDRPVEIHNSKDAVHTQSFWRSHVLESVVSIFSVRDTATDIR